MNDFEPGDWVRLTSADELNGRTGTVLYLKIPADDSNAYDVFRLHLDEPIGGCIEQVDAFREGIRLLQSRNVITVVASDDGATIVAVHDTEQRRVEVMCSRHPFQNKGFLSWPYDRGITDAAREWLRRDARLSAAKHAAEYHTTPRVDSEGDLS